MKEVKVVTGVLGSMSKSLGKRFDKLGIKIKTEYLQKKALLGTAKFKERCWSASYKKKELEATSLKVGQEKSAVVGFFVPIFCANNNIGDIRIFFIWILPILANITEIQLLLAFAQGVFITKGDIGVGTIIGSAVFNVLFVIGVCGIGAGTVSTIG